MKNRGVSALALAAFVGLGGLGLFVHYYQEAFPAASLNFRLSRDEVYRTAGQYLKDLGHDPDSYHTAAIFTWSQMPQIFLERTLGLEESNRLARDWLSLWSWQVRWYQPLHEEEFRVALDPGGRIVGFSHRIPEDAPGAALAQEEALTLAAAYLRQRQQLDLSGYDLVDRSTTVRPHRVDHEFAYRKADFVAGEDGHYRLEVLVQGNRIGGYREYLWVPESFAREYAEIRGRAHLLTGTFQVFWIALGIAALVVLAQYHRSRLLEWQPGVVIGILVAVASVVAGLNSLPLTRYGFDTEQSGTVFLVTSSVGLIFNAAVLGATICLVGTAGNALGRTVLHQGAHTPLGRLTGSGLLSRHFLRATLAGYVIAAGMLGYVTLFYLVGSRHFGLWVPADVSEYSNAFSTVLPWIYPLLAGLSASALEEFFFRFLAISLLVRWLKRTWIAVLIPAVVWAFLHSNYPVEPIYARGVELTLVGIVLGAAFLRYGIWAPIVAHYAYNAFITAYPMIRSTSLYFQLSGLAVTGLLLLPAIPALFAVLTGRSPGKLDKPAAVAVPEARTPTALPSSAPAPELRQPPRLHGLRLHAALENHVPDRRTWIAAGMLACAGAVLILRIQPVPFGSRNLTLSVTRAEAVRTAQVFTRQIGLDTRGFRHSVEFHSTVGSQDHVHLARTAGMAPADTLMFEHTSPWMWYVRWFKPLEKEELWVGVDASGRGVRFLEHRIPETRAGAQLTADSARVLAVDVARRHFGLPVDDPDRYALLEDRSTQRQARLDHHFVWERWDHKFNGGEFRVHLGIQGDTVGRTALYYRAPVAFLREHRQQDAGDLVAQVGRLLLTAVTVVLCGLCFLRTYRDRVLTGRFPACAGAAMALTTLVHRINLLPVFHQHFDTSQSMQTFLGRQAVGLLLEMAFSGLGYAATLMLLVALYRTRFDRGILPGCWLRSLSLKTGSSRFWTGTVALAMAMALYHHGGERLAAYAGYRWFTAHLVPGDFTIPGINTHSLFLFGLTEAMRSFLLPLAVLGVVLVWKQAVGRTWVVVAMLFAALPGLQALSQGGSALHVVLLLGLHGVIYTPLLYVVLRVARLNLLVYCIAFYIGKLVFGLGLTYLHPAVAASCRTQGLVLILLGLVPLLLPIGAWFRQWRRTVPA